MVSSLCRDPDPDRPLANGTAIVFFSFQPSREGGRFRLLPDPRIAIHNPWRLAGLCGYPFLDQLVSRTALDTTACRRHVIVSWPSLCILAWGVTTPTPICVTIQQAVTNRVAERVRFRLF